MVSQGEEDFMNDLYDDNAIASTNMDSELNTLVPELELESERDRSQPDLGRDLDTSTTDDAASESESSDSSEPEVVVQDIKRPRLGVETKPPAVVAACFRNYRVTAKNREAECLQCKGVIKSGISGTSNWVRHINEAGHEEMAKRYRAAKEGKNVQSSQQPSGSGIDKYFKVVAEKWCRTDKQQKALRSAVTNAVVMCSLPLSIVENEHFRAAFEVAQPRFNHIDRRSVTADIECMYDEIQLKLKQQLRETTCVSVTVDIWSDRKMRSFLGVTAHYLSNDTLHSKLMACETLTGSHTGARIKAEFRKICQEYEVEDKLGYIISDNAANMRKAFQVSMTEDNTDVADEDIWNMPEGMDQDEISIATVHLRCFAHTLQLVVRDGLKSIRTITLIGKCSRIATLLHKSTIFKDAFTHEFNDRTSIQQPNDTRWNSMFTHLKSVQKLDQTKLNKALDAARSSHVKITQREHSQLTEIICILQPFYEVTQKTQGEKVVTISIVAPSVVQVEKSIMKLQVLYMKRLRDELLDSLRERFAGIYRLIRPDEGIDEKRPFEHRIYLLSAVLDGNWGARWLEYVCPEKVLELKERVKGMLTEEVANQEWEEDFVAVTPESQKSSQAQSSMESSIFDDFLYAKETTTDLSASGEHEIYRVMNNMNNKKVNAIKVWSEESSMRRLRKLALKYLSVPATSAPIERVFSVGGHIITPHRSSLKSEQLSRLMVIKCNKM